MKLANHATWLWPLSNVSQTSHCWNHMPWSFVPHPSCWRYPIKGTDSSCQLIANKAVRYPHLLTFLPHTSTRLSTWTNQKLEKKGTCQLQTRNTCRLLPGSLVQQLLWVSKSERPAMSSTIICTSMQVSKYLTGYCATSNISRGKDSVCALWINLMP